MPIALAGTDPASALAASGIEDPSRRSFLQAAATGVVTAALPAIVTAAPGSAGRSPEPTSRLEEILERYGSEFGTVRRVRTRQDQTKVAEGY